MLSRENSPHNSEVYEEMSFVPVKPQPPPSPHRWAASCSRHVKRVSRSSRFHSSLQNKTGQNTSPSVPPEICMHGPLELGPIRSSLTPLQTSTMFTPMSVAVKPNEGEVSRYREVGDIVTTMAVGQGFIYILMGGSPGYA